MRAHVGVYEPNGRDPRTVSFACLDVDDGPMDRDTAAAVASGFSVAAGHFLWVTFTKDADGKTKHSSHRFTGTDIG